MNISAMILMATVQISVIAITIYFFWKVLKAPPKPEEDSYTDNDNVER